MTGPAPPIANAVVGGVLVTMGHARTIRAGWLARTTLAPYWVSYHLDHHLLVFVPCWKLRAAHRFLLAKNLGPPMERAGSYAEVIGRATT